MDNVVQISAHVPRVDARTADIERKLDGFTTAELLGLAGAITAVSRHDIDAPLLEIGPLVADELEERHGGAA